MTIRALIVDDEQLAREELEYLLRAAGDVEIVAQGRNGVEAVELVRAHQPDVVFLDVQMPVLDGFAVLKKLLGKDRKTPLPSIVFATAFDQYAVRAFEVNAVDYLLKPFDEVRVRQAIHKVRQRLLESMPSAATSGPSTAASGPGAVASTHHHGNHVKAMAGGTDGEAAAQRWGDERPVDERGVDERSVDERLDALMRLLEQQQMPARPTAGKIVLRANGRLLLADQRDICFASIEEGTISVVTNTIEGHSNCRTLEELLELLEPERFWRAHRSFVVNIQHIQEVVPWFKSSYQLRMDDRRHTEIPVSRTQTRRLRELFNL